MLVSGGLDSGTMLALADSQGYEVYCLSFDYGQHSRSEIAAAKRLAERYRVADHRVIPVGLDRIGGSALLGFEKVPAAGQAKTHFGIPETYVPARNTVFLSLGLGWAEVLGAYHVFIGANAVDYSGYPDCRPEYIDAYNQLARLAVAEGSGGGRPIRIEAPLMQMTKGEIVALGLRLGLDYALTVSCYDATADGLACGVCDSCSLRLKGFADAGSRDPAKYVRSPYGG